MLPLMIVKKVKWNVESEIYDIFNNEFVYDVEANCFRNSLYGGCFTGF